MLGSPYLCVSHPLSTLRSNPRSLSSCWCSNTFLLCWMASWTCQAHTVKSWLQTGLQMGLSCQQLSWTQTSTAHVFAGSPGQVQGDCSSC